MFGILIYDVLFFAIPIALLAFLGVSIYRYASAKKKNAKAPGTFSPNEVKTRKTILIIASVYNGPHVKTNPEKIIVNQIIPY